MLANQPRQPLILLHRNQPAGFKYETRLARTGKRSCGGARFMSHKVLFNALDYHSSVSHSYLNATHPKTQKPTP